MKKSTSLPFYAILINLLSFCCVNAQNLVPNPGFENAISCPMGQGAIYGAPPWFQPCIAYGNTSVSSSTDLFDTCSNSSTVGIPLNVYGYQQSHSGHGYSGIFVTYYNMNYREYIEVPLSSSLINNKKYCVEFYVSLADTSQKAISSIGAYFSFDSLLDNRFGSPSIDYVIPQIENPSGNILNNKNSWVLVSGNFIATGGEKFITIGNFHADSASNIQNVGSGTEPFAYYYIDDVSVTDCTVGINELEAIGNFKLYPNPNDGNMVLQYQLDGTETGLITIYDITGRMVKQEKLNAENKTLLIHANELNAGTYYYEIKVGDKKVKLDKLVIIK